MLPWWSCSYQRRRYNWLQTGTDKGNHHSQNCDCKNVSCMTGSPTSSSILLPPSTTTDTNPEEDIFIRIHWTRTPRTSYSGGFSTCNSVEWEGYHPSCPRPDQKIRCLYPGMGSSLQRDNGITTGGHRSNQEMSHHMSLLELLLRSQGIYQTKEQCPRTTADGQPLFSLICAQDGWHSLTEPWTY